MGKLTIGMVYKWTSSNIWNDAIWKSSGATYITKGYSVAKLNTGAGQGTGFWYSSFNTSLKLNGSVLSEATHGRKY